MKKRNGLTIATGLLFVSLTACGTAASPESIIPPTAGESVAKVPCGGDMVIDWDETAGWDTPLEAVSAVIEGESAYANMTEKQRNLAVEAGNQLVEEARKSPQLRGESMRYVATGEQGTEVASAEIETNPQNGKYVVGILRLNTGGYVGEEC